MAVNRDFFDVRMRADLLELCGDTDAAESLRERSLDEAREIDLICYGYQLLWRNRAQDAIAVLERNAARNPDSWNAWDTLGDACADYGDLSRAADCYGKASHLTVDDGERLRIDQKLRDLIALGAIAS